MPSCMSANAGPPLLPGLIAASIWMLSRRPARAYDAKVTRLTMPRVMLSESPPTG